ncbi:MAG: hypothetical protein K0M46_03710 [Thiobacillus sp.]|nr:hypothetical protein [Thiobacillus sp.]
MSAREGCPLERMSGVMMLQLRMLLVLVLAPGWLNRLGVAFALLGVTWRAGRIPRTL